MLFGLKYKWHLLIGLLLFVAVFVFYKALNNENIQTEYKQQPFPMIKISSLDNQAPQALNDLTQEASIVHIWASWCGICIDEHQTWINIKDKWHYPLVGVVFRDDGQKVLNFLAEKGSPYNWILNDAEGTLGVALGLVGTPQTFIVDKKGVIQFHYLGAVDESIFKKEFVPVLERLNKA